MRILNIGSLNIDKVYNVSHFVRPGETLSSTQMLINGGGKGLNQSLALAKSKAHVFHAGKIGPDGLFLVDMLHSAGVDTGRIIKDDDIFSGHAIIQVDSQGQNCIILYPGANRAISENDVSAMLDGFGSDDYLLLQNETSCLNYSIEQAYKKGMKIILNPSPMDETVKSCDLSRIFLLIMNEIEGKELSGQDDPQDICNVVLSRFPDCRIVLTLGRLGVVYADSSFRCSHPIYDIPVVDTTAAGDTFTGFFLSKILSGGTPQEALELASKASGIAVSRKGASSSIPYLEEVLSYNASLNQDFLK